MSDDQQIESDLVHCRVCGASAAYLFSGTVLGREVKYYECGRCGYVFTGSYEWLEHAYAEVMNRSDTGVLERNLANARITLVTLWKLGILNGKVVDYAGGHGLLVRRLRDLGINARWADPYAENLLARGCEYDEGRGDLVTAFEAFEHFADPSGELKNMLDIAPNVLFSTRLIPDPAPPPGEWWYYGEEHGQHIGFFRRATLLYLAGRTNKTLITDGQDYHLLADERISEGCWKLLLRLKKPLARLIKLGLESKTRSDHLRLRSRMKEESLR